MKKFLCLCFVVFLVFGCSDISNYKTEASIFLDFDLKNILSKNSISRNVLENVNSEYQFEISLYNVKKSSVFDKSKATLISTSSPKIEDGKVSVGFNNIRVGLKVVIAVELYEISASNEKKLIYIGESDIFTVKNTKNSVQVKLEKVQSGESEDDKITDNNGDSSENDKPGESVDTDNDGESNESGNTDNDGEFDESDDTENPDVILEDFSFFTQNDGVGDIPVETGYKRTNNYIQVTVNEPSDVWLYYVKTQAKRSFEPGKNYKVSVDLKADEKTVVAVAANRADMYFTVGTEWETFTFETGLIRMEETHNISIGCGLSKNTYIRNLQLEECVSNLPTLSFNIETEGIQEYLNSDIDEPILQVKRVFDEETNSKEVGHELKLNSKGVTFQIRDYGMPNQLNVANFEIETENEGLFSAPEKVDTDFSSNYADAWIEGTEITPNKYNEYAVYFPLYTDEIKDFENIEATSPNNQNLVPCAIEGFLQEYGEVPEHPIYIRGFGISSASSLENKGKTFAIKVGDSFSKSYELPFSADVKNLSPNSEVVFDVLLANDFVQDDTEVQINWTDCTRFLYNGESEIEGKLQFIIGNDNEGNPIYKLYNSSGNDVSFRINLTTDLKVEIVVAEE